MSEAEQRNATSRIRTLSFQHAGTRPALRRLVEADAATFSRLLNDAAVLRTLPFEPLNPAQAARFIRNLSDQPRAWRALDCAAAQPAGFCGLSVEMERQSAEAWYFIEPALWGRGLATEALRLLLAEAFTTLELHRVWAHVLPENAASIRVLEKAGLRREGHLRSNLRLHGEWRDTLLYAVLREEWTQAQSTNSG